MIPGELGAKTRADESTCANKAPQRYCPVRAAPQLVGELVQRYGPELLRERGCAGEVRGDGRSAKGQTCGRSHPGRDQIIRRSASTSDLYLGDRRRTIPAHRWGVCAWSTEGVRCTFLRLVPQVLERPPACHCQVRSHASVVRHCFPIQYRARSMAEQKHDGGTCVRNVRIWRRH